MYKKCILKCHPDKTDKKINHDIFLLLTKSIEKNELYIIFIISKYYDLKIKLKKEDKILLNFYVDYLDLKLNNLKMLINNCI